MGLQARGLYLSSARIDKALQLAGETQSHYDGIVYLICNTFM